MVNINNNAFEVEVTEVESPFPITDIGHKGQLRITNNSGEPNTLTGYVASFIATVNGKEVILKVDNSADHPALFHHVTGGMYLFNTDKMGPCTDNIYLSEFPIELSNNEKVHIHFYFANIDILESLRPYDINDAARAKEKGLKFKIKVEINLAQSYPSWNMQGEKEVTIQ
jgi:hypothetical protein